MGSSKSKYEEGPISLSPRKGSSTEDNYKTVIIGLLCSEGPSVTFKTMTIQLCSKNVIKWEVILNYVNMEYILDYVNTKEMSKYLKMEDIRKNLDMKKIREKLNTDEIREKLEMKEVNYTCTITYDGRNHLTIKKGEDTEEIDIIQRLNTSVKLEVVIFEKYPKMALNLVVQYKDSTGTVRKEILDQLFTDSHAFTTIAEITHPSDGNVTFGKFSFCDK